MHLHHLNKVRPVYWKVLWRESFLVKSTTGCMKEKRGSVSYEPSLPHSYHFLLL